MSFTNTFKSAMARSVAVAAIVLAAACSQGSSISSPGATDAGTPPGGSTGGSTGGSGSGATCPSGFTEGTPVGGLTTCDVSGAYLTNVTLTNVDGIAYRLSGRVDIGTDVGAEGNIAGSQPAVMTIEPGVTIFGESGSDYLVVNRGSQLVADGTASQPIIFTSANDLERQADTDPSNDLGGDAISEWGGLVLLGQAPINRCKDAATPATAQCENIVEGVTNPEAVYGGADTTDNSGVLDYVQVRFAGFAINTQGNELNGITFAGIGSGTRVENIQVHNNSDDGVEFFGGNVNIKHLVLTGNDDDSIDTDNGYSGHIQYAVVVQRENGGDNITEASSVSSSVAPQSNPQISNFTFIGNRTNAFRLNTGTIGRYMNGVVNFGQECFRYEPSAGNGVAGFQAGEDPTFNSVLFDCDGGIATANSDAAAAQGAVAADANNALVTDTLASVLFPGPAELGVTPFDASTVSSFFEPTTYIGAFGPAETVTNNWAAGWTFALFPEPTCPTGTTDSGFDIQGKTVCRLSGQISSDIRLTRGNYYEIAGRVDVGVDTGPDGAATGGVPASLTIESGVTLFGNEGDDYVVVNRGSQIFSNGTAANPVVFTSEADVTDSQVDPENAIGEWGGLVILGSAPINRCRDAATPGSAQCENIVEGVTSPEAVYGGGDAADDSGSFAYTLVKHAGYAINTQGNELNGITFAGVGTGTEVNYVQVHNNSDDGVEFFGGGVNIKHLVLTGNDDDSIDTDNGYNGHIQYAIVVQRAAGGDNITEASSVSSSVTPQSNPIISNFTFVGNRTNAFRLNTGTIGHYLNGVVDYGKECIRFQDSAGNAVAGYQEGADPKFSSVLFDCAGGLATAADDAAAAQGAVDADANNSTNVANTLTSTFVNGSAEAAVTAVDPSTVSPFFDAVDYIGAVENAQDTWWQGWSCGLEASDPC
ncbi:MULTISPECIES: hypothetical protein [Hyphomonas]|nr:MULTISPECIES: hypothetical protein [Hyphomonas]